LINDSGTIFHFPEESETKLAYFQDINLVFRYLLAANRTSNDTANMMDFTEGISTKGGAGRPPCGRVLSKFHK
jgi:hypothetical protein